jgi:peroxiredoxin
MNQEALLALRAAFVRSQDMDAPLHERLDAYSNAVRAHIPDYAAAVDQLAERLTSHNAGASSPHPGELMPPFVLPDEFGRLVSLEQLLQDGPVAITFHRGHWCPWCRISLNALARVNGTIVGLRGQVVAIVPEQQRFAAELKAQAKSPFPVLTDMDNGYALSLNLAIWVGPDLERLLASYGLDLAAYQGNASWMLPIPATFVVAPDGYVTARFMDPDFRRRMAVEELLEALRTSGKR